MKIDQNLTICIGCAGGEALAVALGPGVKTVPCMNVCDRPATVSLRAEGKWAYLFGNVTPDMAEELFTLAQLFDDAPEGDITDARAIPSLRHCLIGRIPG